MNSPTTHQAIYLLEAMFQRPDSTHIKLAYHGSEIPPNKYHLHVLRQKDSQLWSDESIKMLYLKNKQCSNVLKSIASKFGPVL